jgi:hypothetical protein
MSLLWDILKPLDGKSTFSAERIEKIGTNHPEKIFPQGRRGTRWRWLSPEIGRRCRSIPA